MKREVIETLDGSKTIYLPEMNENYHSGNGALQEALHIFIIHGLRKLRNKQEVKIFEVGFGTGLNSFLSMIEAEKNQQKIHYTGIEAYPLEMELIDQLAYEKLNDSKLKDSFIKLHSSKWNEIQIITDYFTFEKIHQKIQDYSPKKETIDLIFFDAFGPQVQQEMWEIDVLRKMYEMLKKDGVLVTYCAKGQFKRDLKSLGFKVESIPGPPGKREMTRAIKTNR